jgi:E3 ubiquitin-protein ligase HUWE1
LFPFGEYLNKAAVYFQPVECQVLIDKLRYCSRKELLEGLKVIDTWTYGKCELYHWIDILDMGDVILEEAATRVEPTSWTLACDLPQNAEVSANLRQAGFRI